MDKREVLTIETCDSEEQIYIDDFTEDEIKVLRKLSTKVSNGWGCVRRIEVEFESEEEEEEDPNAIKYQVPLGFQIMIPKVLPDGTIEIYRNPEMDKYRVKKEKDD